MTNQKPLVVITGASSGIGAACAYYFSQLGHPLLLLARRVERLRSFNLPNTLCLKVDVSDRVAFQAAVEQAEAKYGTVDLLINNAGTAIGSIFVNQSPDKWAPMIDANIYGVLNGMYAVIQKMIQNQHGTIVNVSSIVGRKALSGLSVYSATKHFVHALTDSIRQEVGDHNVRVLIVAPGYVATELTTSKPLPPTATEPPGKQFLVPRDIAEAIGFAYSRPQRVAIKEILITPTVETD